MRSRFIVRPKNLLIGFILIYGISPFVCRVISSTVSTYGYLAVLVITFAIVAMKNTEELINVYVFSILPLLIYCILTLSTNTDPIYLWGYKSLIFLFPVIIGVYLIRIHYNGVRWAKNIILLGVVVTAITTMVGVIQYPSAARYLATVENAADSFCIELNWHNIGGYSFIYILVLLYPMLICAYKKQRIGKITLISGLLIVFGTVILSEYTTALIFLIISSLLLLLKRDLQTKDIVAFFVITIIATYLLQDILSSGLIWLSNVIKSENISERLLALAGGTSGLQKSGDAARLDKYVKSIDAFLKSPIYGNLFGNTTECGGHSAILDILGNYGIVGGAVLFWAYKKIYDLFYRPFKKRSGYGYYLWVFIQSIILSCFNTGLWIQVLALYAPIVFVALDEEKNDESALDY